MKIVLAQINPTVGDIRGNSLKIRQAIADAKKMGGELVVFPELALSGYPPEDLLLLPSFIDAMEEALKSLVAATGGISAIIGTVRRNHERIGKSLYNSAAVMIDGVLAGFQDKMLLPTYDVFDERRFFEPGRENRLWNIYGKHVGITICEDIWQHSSLLKFDSYQHDPVEELAVLLPDVVVNLSASPFSVSKFHDRFEVCSKAAIAVKAPLLLCNQVGGNDSLIFDGRSLFVNSKGELVVHAKGFAEDLLLVDLSKEHLPGKFVVEPMQELHDALVLGLRDYFHKSGFTKGCVGLSGGIDSALVAYLAVEALGRENVLGVLMPSRYSSPGSIEDAEELVKTLGIESHMISIELAFESYLDTLDPYLDSSQPGVTEENLQARIRGMILMALSNKTGCIVLSTGNKSELAMGYSTLYGDMCGGLAVISDLTKQQVYALSRWINRDGVIIPENTINKPPSAELRPNQKDSDSLPDYSVVDHVLQDYIEGHQDPAMIAKRFGYSLEMVESLIQRIYRNEYKRRQSPPGLRVSEKAFSVGRRFPIVQGWVK
ncbi:MAG TPA: NAD+ synthase [Parachlamydiaceae bacterium]|nr:NAD+ synthase [Parachlamydiaceae bacterium]